MNLPPLLTRPLFLGFLAAALGLLYFAYGQKWDGFELVLNPNDFLTKITPLILSATFIERAVEILVSPWRDTDASKLDRIVAMIKARPAAAAGSDDAAKNAADLQKAAGDVDDYRGQTQKYAFAAGLVLSLGVSVAGVRALWPFVPSQTLFQHLAWQQQSYFRNVDVVITTALLAGGADGFHSILNTIGGFFPNAKKSSDAGPAGG